MFVPWADLSGGHLWSAQSTRQRHEDTPTSSVWNVSNIWNRAILMYHDHNYLLSLHHFNSIILYQNIVTPLVPVLYYCIIVMIQQIKINRSFLTLTLMAVLWYYCYPKSNVLHLKILLPLYSYVEGLAELVVRNGKDIAQLQEQGNRVRKVAATEMNQRSSRSHSVFSLHIKQRDTDDSNDQGLKAKVNLVDLAGSERADATGAQGQTLREGAAINKRYVKLAIITRS